MTDPTPHAETLDHTNLSSTVWHLDTLPDLNGAITTPRTGPGHQGDDEQGPLVRQPAPAARLARILHAGATDLWDLCTYTDRAQMWEEARAIASRILAACPGD